VCFMRILLRGHPLMIQAVRGAMGKLSTHRGRGGNPAA
jgi:hypothetical protein